MLWSVERPRFLVILIFLINESHSSMELSCHSSIFFRPTGERGASRCPNSALFAL
jgi:hypothetical protein